MTKRCVHCSMSLSAGTNSRKDLDLAYLRGEPSLAGYVLSPVVRRVDDSDGFKQHRTISSVNITITIIFHDNFC